MSETFKFKTLVLSFARHTHYVQLKITYGPHEWRRREKKVSTISVCLHVRVARVRARLSIILNRNFSASVSSNGFASKRDRLSSRGLYNIVAIVQVDITDDDIIVYNIVQYASYHSIVNAVKESSGCRVTMII